MARNLVINGTDYGLMLDLARQRIHREIDIRADRARWFPNRSEAQRRRRERERAQREAQA